MDPLSDVLSLLKPHSYSSGGVDAGGKWSIRFPPFKGIKCYAVASGQCWLQLQDDRNAIHLRTGDCFLLPSGRAFRLASDLEVPPVNVETLFSTPLNGRVLSFNQGGSCLLVGGYFGLTGPHARVMLELLPRIVHIKKESEKVSLRWCLERMRQELQERQPGEALLVQQLAYIMLIQALRLHLAEGLKDGAGWLFALADKQLGAALHAMHEHPARRWTIETLAKRAGMSRTSFALKFKQTVGSSPIEYLTQWRMLLAGDRLENSSDPISVIAPSLGYESDSAFSTAFKRVMGSSPRRYMHQQESRVLLQ